MTGLSVKSITGETSVGMCPWLVWFVRHVPFFSVIMTLLFDFRTCIFNVKDFNCSNSFIPLPFIELGHQIVVNLGQSYIWKLWSDAYTRKWSFWATWPQYWAYWLILILQQSFCIIAIFLVTLSQSSCFLCIHCKWSTFETNEKISFS